MPIDRAWLSMTLKDSFVGITGICGHKSDLFAPEYRSVVGLRITRQSWPKRSQILTRSLADWSIFETNTTPSRRC